MVQMLLYSQASNLDEAINQAYVIELAAEQKIQDVIFDTKAIPSVLEQEQSFILQGKAFNKTIISEIFNPKTSKIKIKKKGKGVRNLQLTTDYPDLISFANDGIIKITKRQKVRKVKVTVSNYSNLVDAIPAINNGAKHPCYSH